MTGYLSPRNLAKLLLPLQPIKHDRLWVSSVTVKILYFHYLECEVYLNTTCLMAGLSEQNAHCVFTFKIRLGLMLLCELIARVPFEYLNGSLS